MKGQATNMRNAILVIVGLFFALGCGGPAAARKPPAKPAAAATVSDTYLEQLYSACRQGGDAIRQRIAKSGVKVHLRLLDYSDHKSESVTDRHVLPAEVGEDQERWICLAFEDKRSDQYSQGCRPGERKGAV